jgi:Putative ParB-like nuclease
MSQPPSIPGPEALLENKGCRSLRAIFAPREDLRLASAPIEVLRPTQITVGFREVAEKRRRWRAAMNAVQLQALPRRIVPVVIGPSVKLYALDRHHWICAFAAEGVRDASVLALDDLAHLEEAKFWTILESRGWCHPYDALGRRRAWAEMPTSMAQLMDDPFRSLAGALGRRLREAPRAVQRGRLGYASASPYPAEPGRTQLRRCAPGGAPPVERPLRRRAPAASGRLPHGAGDAPRNGNLIAPVRYPRPPTWRRSANKEDKR